MKKLNNYYLMALLAATLTFWGCDDSDDPVTDPTVTTYTDGTDAASGQSSVTVKDNGQGTGTITWTKDKVYVLDGFVFVNEGQTLTIEAGTVVKGKPGTGESASALIVARGAKIMAQGTAAEPILFVPENDPLDGSASVTRGEWGGLIVLGNAGLNSTPGSTQIEGIPDTEARGLYGGTANDDDSGMLTYISIRNGGSNIGADNEINGLTLGGVGSGTTVSYIEVFANADDGIEWFGGTVNGDHLIAAACGDDGLDYDEGYRGTNQFCFVYFATDNGDRGGEHDGGTDPETAEPYAVPSFWNLTSVGRGVAADKRALTLRDNAGGKFYNSIFYEYGKGVDIEHLGNYNAGNTDGVTLDNATESQSSRTQFTDGNILLSNLTFGKIGSLNTTTAATGVFKVGLLTDDDGNATKQPSTALANAFQTELDNEWTSKSNKFDDAVIARGDVVPATDDTDVQTGAPTTAAYRGAFQAGQTPWYDGWTAVRGIIQ